MCASTCLTRDHKTWGECVRSKNLRIAYCRSASGMDYSSQKVWDNNLDAYSNARKEGIQPDSTNIRDVRRAVELSDRTGEAYGHSGGTE